MSRRRSRPYHKRWHGDALGGMRELTLEERGAYNTLLDLMYDRQGPWPDDERRTCGELNCDIRVWRRVRASLAGKGKIAAHGGLIYARRVHDELGTSGQLPAEVREKFAIAIQQLSPKSIGKDKENNAPENEKNPSADLLLPLPESKERKPPTPLKGEPSSRRKPRRAIPDTFPTLALIEEQQRKAILAGADLDVSAEAERFRNHALSTDRRCSDWTAAWRNWVLKAIGWAPKAARSSLPTEPADPWPRRLLGWRTSAYWNSEWGPKPGRDGYRGPPVETKEAAA